MNTSKNYLNASIDDMVFENRNKAYGAYQLRKNSEKNLAIAMFIGLLFASGFTAFSLNKKPAVTDKEDIVVISTITKIENQIDIPEPEVIEPVVQEVAKTATKAFAEMIVKQDNQVVEDNTPTIEDLKGKVIGATDEVAPDIEQPILKEKVVAKDPVVAKKDFVMIAGQMPEYNGGMLALQRYLQKSVRYPEMAKQLGIEGKVYVSFIIETDGSISNIELVRGIGGGCDEEAMKRIAQMDKWIPGKNNGELVRVKQTIPIDFQLEVE